MLGLGRLRRSGTGTPGSLPAGPAHSPRSALVPGAAWLAAAAGRGPAGLRLLRDAALYD